MLIQKEIFTERQKFLNIVHFQATSYNAEDCKGWGFIFPFTLYTKEIIPSTYA